MICDSSPTRRILHYWASDWCGGEAVRGLRRRSSRRRTAELCSPMRAMFVVGKGRAAVRNHHHSLKSSIMASRAVASQQILVLVPATSTVSMSRLRSSRSRLGRTGNQRAIAVLDDLGVGGSTVSPDQTCWRPGARLLLGLFSHVVGDDVIEEQLPVAAAAALRIGMQHPDDGHADLAQLLRQRVDRLDDVPRSRHRAGAPGAQNNSCMSMMTSAVRRGSSSSNQ